MHIQDASLVGRTGAKYRSVSIYIIYMVNHVCIFRMRGRSAGRHIDRPRDK